MNELYHHGIKGQKWGVRRFQNYDGTRTEAGKRRTKLQQYGGEGVNLRDEFFYLYEKGEPASRTANDFILKRGTQLKRVTSNPNEKFKDRMYVSANPQAYYNTGMQHGKRTGYEDTYKSTSELMIAGQQAIQNALNTVSDKKVDILRKPKYSDIPKNSKRDFYKNNPELAKKVSEELRKNGYDGLLDPIDSSIGYDYENSAIIMINDALIKIGHRQLRSVTDF